MAGFQERTEAAASAIRLSIKGSLSIMKEAARIAVDPKAGNFAQVNGVLFAAAVPVMMLPLAVGEAVAAFIKPSAKKE